MSFNVTPGAIRFNTDSMKLEYYHLGSVGVGTLATGEWVQITTDTPDIQTGGTRGLFMGGFSGPTTHDVVDYINVDTLEMQLILEFTAELDLVLHVHQNSCPLWWWIKCTWCY